MKLICLHRWAMANGLRLVSSLRGEITVRQAHTNCTVYKFPRRKTQVVGSAYPIPTNRGK